MGCDVVAIHMAMLCVDFLGCDDVCQIEASQHSEESQSCTNLMSKLPFIFSVAMAFPN